MRFGTERYVLTERGKLLVVLLVILFAVLPSAILISWAVTRETEAPFDVYPDGTLTFLWRADLQEALDESTVTRIGTFLTSPHNKEDAKIVVEIPQLPDEDAIRLTSAIIDAFSANDVSTSDIIFIVYQPDDDADVRIFEITVSFMEPS